MKILMVSTLNLSESNGGTVHFTSLAKEFSRAGHIVEAIVPSTGVKEVDDRIAAQYFHQVRFSNNSLSQFIPISKTSINSLLQTLLAFTHNPSDYDWVYLRSNVLSLAVLLTLKYKGFKKIVTEHNGWFADELSMMGVADRWKWWIKKLQIADANSGNLVRVVVAGIKEKLIEYGIKQEKIFVIGNGTDTSLFRPLKRAEVLKKIGLDVNYFYLGFIGDLELWQGVEVAIKAMSIITQNHPQTRLLVVGGGRRLDYLRKTYSAIESVQFFGSVPYDRSNDYINCFDIALLPKHGLDNIGFSPIKLGAYAAAGRPIVASNIRGVRELETAKFVSLHQPGNSEDLAAKILAIMSSQEELSKMGAIARQYAEQHFSWKLVAEKILQAMQDYSEDQSK